jgi:hypothetical protein
METAADHQQPYQLKKNWEKELSGHSTWEISTLKRSYFISKAKARDQSMVTRDRPNSSSREEKVGKAPTSDVGQANLLEIHSSLSSLSLQISNSQVNIHWRLLKECEF